MLCAYHAMWAMGKTYAVLEVRTVLPLMCTVDRRLTLLRCRCCLLYAVNVHESLSVALAADHRHARQCQVRRRGIRTRLTRPRYPDPEADQLVPVAHQRAFLVPCNSAAPGSTLVHLSDSSCGRIASGKAATSRSVSYRLVKSPHTPYSQLAPFR